MACPAARPFRRGRSEGDLSLTARISLDVDRVDSGSCVPGRQHDGRTKRRLRLQEAEKPFNSQQPSLCSVSLLSPHCGAPGRRAVCLDTLGSRGSERLILLEVAAPERRSRARDCGGNVAPLVFTGHIWLLKFLGCLYLKRLLCRTAILARMTICARLGLARSARRCRQSRPADTLTQ